MVPKKQYYYYYVISQPQFNITTLLNVVYSLVIPKLGHAHLSCKLAFLSKYQANLSGLAPDATYYSLSGNKTWVVWVLSFNH